MALRYMRHRGDTILKGISSDVDSEDHTKEIIGERPNTYTFTKAIAEQLVNREREHLPISVVRPSIVTGSVKEPIPGWVDNLNGPAGVGKENWFENCIFIDEFFFRPGRCCWTRCNENHV